MSEPLSSPDQVAAPPRQRKGIRVTCVVCGYMKKPIGRSEPLGASYCDDECSGYRQPPYVGSLWPGETTEDFGYPVGSDGTEEI